MCVLTSSVTEMIKVIKEKKKSTVREAKHKISGPGKIPSDLFREEMIMV